MITLHLTRADDSKGAYLRLPAFDDEIDESFRWLDLITKDTSTTKIVGAASNVCNLSGYLKNVDVENAGELSKLNALARRIQTLNEDSCLKFEGVLDANSVNGIDDLLRLSEALEEYTLLSDAADESALGRYLVQNDIVPFPESVWPYLDYRIIGSEFYAEHGGAFCRAGYVVRKDELPMDFVQEEPAIDEGIQMG